MTQEEQEEREETREMAEDRFLIPLKAKDFDRKDKSENIHLVIFEADKEIVTTYPVPRTDKKKSAELARRVEREKTLRRINRAGVPNSRRRKEEADQLRRSNRRDKRLDEHDRYTKTAIAGLNHSGVDTVVIGNGPSALDEILYRQAVKRDIETVRLIDDDDRDIEEQTTRLMKIDLLARVRRQHEKMEHPAEHLCFGCLYEATREAVKCSDWYERTSVSWRAEPLFDVHEVFTHAIHLVLWKLLGFENPPDKRHDLPKFRLPPRKAHKRVTESLIKRIMDGGSASEFSAIVQTLDPIKHGRVIGNAVACNPGPPRPSRPNTPSPAQAPHFRPRPEMHAGARPPSKSSRVE